MTVTASQDDSGIIRACREGRGERFGVLVNRYRRKAYFAALAITHNPDDALDVTQEAFYRAFRSIGSFDVDRPFYPWLRTIIRNTALTWRSKKRPAPAGDALEPRPWTVTPEMLAIRNEQVEQLRGAMNRLDAPHREILHLRHFEDLSYKQIAEVLDIPPGTVMSRLYAARSQLRKLLQEVGP